MLYIGNECLTALFTNIIHYFKFCFFGGLQICGTRLLINNYYAFNSIKSEKFQHVALSQHVRVQL